MNKNSLPDYTNMVIQVIDDPKAEDIGNGWWRIVWDVITDPAEPPCHLQLPTPSAELGDMAFILAVLPQEPGKITVQMLSRDKKLTWNEYAYVSLVMQHIRKMYRRIRINDQENHPILKISRA